MQDKDNNNFPNVKRQGWNAEEISEEAANKQPDEIAREFLRGDETEGNPDERDIVGGVEFIDTPHGRKETKHQTEERGKNDR